MRYIILSLFLCFSFLGLSQISFHHQEDWLNASFNSTIPVGITDMNGDLLDDIVLLNAGKTLQVAFQGLQNDRFYLSAFDFSQINSQWSMTLGDLNNDNRIDLIIGGAYDESKVLMQSSDRSDFVMSETINDDCFVQGSNTMDINNDGWLDYFVCNDDAMSRIFVNDGTGHLVRNMVIDFQTIPSSDNSGNYGSEWVDVNGDELLDLYIAKCRAGVTSSADPRRINSLYINNGDGTFTEGAAGLGLNIGAQSWSSSFGDMDNDGDFDCLIANHGSPHLILENENNTSFSSIPFYLEELQSSAFQSLWSDFDNDGFLDALIIGGSPYLLHNNGNKSFSLISNPFGGAQPNSMAIGDLNDDGYLDIYTSFGVNINNPGTERDRIYINDGKENNFLKFNLTGTESNRSAIGAKLKIFGEWGVQVRQVKAGESYGIFNSLTQHFGLGKANQVDSLVVIWPNGMKENYSDLEVNHTYVLTEGKCLTSRISIDNRDIILCDALDTYTIQAPDGYDKYEWNNGATTQSIIVDIDGIFAVSMHNEDGCLYISNPVSVRYNPEIPEYFTTEEIISKCALETVSLQAPEGYMYEWENGEQASSIVAENAGIYTVQMELWCGEMAAKSFIVNEFSAIAPMVDGDDILLGEEAIVVSDLDNVIWLSEDQQTILGEGQSLTLVGLTDTTTVYCTAVDYFYTANTTIPSVEKNPNDLYPPENVNSGLLFDVIRPIKIRSVQVETDTPGERQIIISNEAGDEIFSQVYNLEIGINELVLDLELPAGNGFRIGTDQATNLANFGAISPRLARSNGANVSFPYSIPNAINLTSSFNGPNYYYYFYEWNIEYGRLDCQSEKVAAVVNVTDPSGIDEIAFTDKFILQPNPTKNGKSQLVIDATLSSLQYIIQIRDASGNLVKQIETESVQTELDLSDMPGGIYYLNIYNEDMRRIGSIPCANIK